MTTVTRRKADNLSRRIWRQTTARHQAPHLEDLMTAGLVDDFVRQAELASMRGFRAPEMVRYEDGVWYAYADEAGELYLMRREVCPVLGRWVEKRIWPFAGIPVSCSVALESEFDVH